MKKISMGVAISTSTDHKCPRIELASIRSDAIAKIQGIIRYNYFE